jgi:hypothetical protein
MFECECGENCALCEECELPECECTCEKDDEEEEDELEPEEEEGL